MVTEYRFRNMDYFQKDTRIHRLRRPASLGDSIVEVEIQVELLRGTRRSNFGNLRRLPGFLQAAVNRDRIGQRGHDPHLSAAGWTGIHFDLNMVVVMRNGMDAVRGVA